MRVSNLVGWVAACALALAPGWAGAVSVLLAFPEFTGPSIPSGPYPQPPLEVGTRTFSVPLGEVVIAASVSGFWGASPPGDPNSTAGVDVEIDGIVVAKCVKPDPSCYSGNVGQRPWSYTYKASELASLNDGVAKLTVTQTSESSVNIGVTTLQIQTGPPAEVPTTSPLGLLALFGAISVAASLVLRRRTRG